MVARATQRNESDSGVARLAVLIDSDNAQSSVMDGLLAEIAALGEATVKRIYGDFSSEHGKAWKSVLQRHAIKPQQEFAHTVRKNATDIAMVIDAMDLLYTRRFDGFCLVTSDSDFTGLAMRIREEGLQVYGFGEQKTPESFRNACHRFIFTEILRPEAIALAGSKPSGLPKPGNVVSQPQLVFPVDEAYLALQQASGEEEWASLGRFGSVLRQLRSDFDPRNHGFKKLLDLVKSKPEIFVVQEREGTTAGAKVYYVKGKR